MLIELREVTFSYKKKLPPVLDGASCTFRPGEITALTGANGSGKTTLGKLVLGLLKPCSGAIFFDGADAKRLGAGKRAARIGYLFQNPDMQLFAPSVEEELAFPYRLAKTLDENKKAELCALLARFGLEGMEKRFPLTMSGGEKQRLALATILARRVEFIVLDEPTTAVDSEAALFIARFVLGFAAEGGGAIVITHDEGFLEALDSPRVIRMEGGKTHEA